MKPKIVFQLFAAAFLIAVLSGKAQSRFSNHELSIGKGSSLYRNIKSEQYLLFYNIPDMKGNFENLSYEGDINFEFITENSKTTYVAGFVPMFRYDMTFLNLHTFIRGGVGLNFINSHKVANRSIGGHFIFSDMISIGAKVFSFESYSVEISYLFRHISNAGLFRSNEGFNSQYLVLGIVI
jgi:hypothetical protein